MNRVIENIEYLVHRHDCVVIPSWGAFIAHYQPAVYDEDSFTFRPPMRELSFNPNVSHNDGLLISSVSRRCKMPFNKAASIVESEVEAMKHQLETEGEVALGAVGRFINQPGSTLIFEPDVRLERYQSAALLPLAITPLLKQAEQEARAEEAPVRRHLKLRRAIRVAASVAIVAIAAGIVAIPTVFNRHDELASVSSTVFLTPSLQTSAVPSNSTSTTVYIPLPNETAEVEEVEVVEAVEAVEAVEVAPAPAKSEAATNVNAAKTTAANATNAKVEASAKPEATTTAPAAADRYCLVVASLPTQQQAERFIREAHDSRLQIIAMDGKYRVYVASAPTYEALNAAKTSDVLARYPDAWACRMR